MDQSDKNWRRMVLWPGFVALVAIGIAVAIGRARALLTDWSAFDALAGMFSAQFHEEGLIAERWYAAHGSQTLAHLIMGAVLLAVLPLQVAEWPRRRWPKLHRWVGRTIIVLGIPVGASGLILGALSPFGGRAADVAIFLFGSLFLVSLVRGFQAARRRDFVAHRAWMLRAVAVSVGIATVRVVALPLYAIVGGSPLALVAPTFWLGLSLSVAVAEWWLWRTRGYRPSVAGVV